MAYDVLLMVVSFHLLSYIKQKKMCYSFNDYYKEQFMNFEIFTILSTTAEELQSWPYYINILIGFGVAILQAIVLAIITKIVIDKSLRKSKSIGDGLTKVGIEKVEVKNGKMSISDQNVLFGRNGKQMPTKLKLCFLTGVNFFFDYQEDLRNLVRNGTKVQILLFSPFAHPKYQEYSKRLENYDLNKCIFPTDLRMDIIKYNMNNWELTGDELAKLSYPEREFLMLSEAHFKKLLNGRKYNQLTEEEKIDLWDKRMNIYGSDITETILSMKLLKEINSHSQGAGGIELHFYTDEYQMPITMAEYDYGTSRKNKSFVMLWTNMNAPVRETIKSINVLGMKDGNNDASFVEDVSLSFDYLFNKYPKDYLKAEETDTNKE